MCQFSASPILIPSPVFIDIEKKAQKSMWRHTHTHRDIHTPEKPRQPWTKECSKCITKSDLNL